MRSCSKLAGAWRRFIDERGYHGTAVSVSKEPHLRGAGWCRGSVCTSSSACRLRWERSRSPASRDEAMAMQQRLRGIGGDFRADILRERIAKEEENLRQSGYVEASVDLQIERDGGVVNGRLHVVAVFASRSSFKGSSSSTSSGCAKRSPLRPHERSTMIRPLRASRRSNLYQARVLPTHDPRRGPSTRRDRRPSAQT